MESPFAATIFTVIDTETTGFDPACDQVVEVGFVRLEGGREIERFCTLVNPGREIPAEATAVHGITDADVVDAPRLEAVLAELQRAAEGAVVVAHNAAFDLRFLSALAQWPVICTMRLAMHLVDLPNYRNETLARLFGICGPEGHAAHRALSDALVTADVLTGLLGIYEQSPYPQSIAGLIDVIRRPALLRRFPFGPYRGVALGELPRDYLQSVADSASDFWADARYSATIELSRRGPETDSAPVQPLIAAALAGRFIDYDRVL